MPRLRPGRKLKKASSSPATPRKCETRPRMMPGDVALTIPWIWCPSRPFLRSGGTTRYSSFGSLGTNATVGTTPPRTQGFGLSQRPSSSVGFRCSSADQVTAAPGEPCGRRAKRHRNRHGAPNGHRPKVRYVPRREFGGTSSAASRRPTKKIWRGITMCASCCESPERALLMQKAGVLVSQDSIAFIGSLENRGFSFE